MFSITTIIAGIVGLISVLFGTFLLGHSKGKTAGIAEKQPEVDAAKAETASVVQASKDADVQVKQSADDTSKQIEQTIKDVYSKVDPLPEGEAEKQLKDKYSRD